MELLEVRDLLAAWLVLSVAFSNLYGLGVTTLILSSLTAGTGFLLHELAHRIVARNYGLEASFVADYRWLGLALLSSFAGFLFAAPGAVVTSGRRSRRQQMMISVAGPLTNIMLSVVFMVVPGAIGSFGASINSWLALFNMLPFGGLDGRKVLDANRLVYLTVLAASALLVII